MIPVRTPGTIDLVPNKPLTQHRSVRIDDPEWEDLDAAAQASGLDRAKVINGLLADWMGRPGAEPPPKPPAELMEKIVSARLVREAEIERVALSMPCPTCSVQDGPCVMGRRRRSGETMHRTRVAAAAKAIDETASPEA